MNLFNLFENEHTKRNRNHTVRDLFDRWTNSEYAPFNSDSGDYNEVIRKAEHFLQDIVDPSQVERLALKLSDYWHGEDGTELDEKLGSQLVNRRQAHALITKFKRHSFGEGDATGSEGSGVFAVGDTVLFKGHSAEVIKVDGTAATIRVPNWKNVSGMVDDTTEVDPASHFLELVPHDVSEAGMSDQHKENHLAAVRAYHAKKKADKEQRSADSRGAFNNWMGGSPEDQTDFMNIRKKGVTENQQLVDMRGKKCTTCKKGTYQETDIQDDMHGELHCTKCNKVVKSRQPAKTKEKGVSEGKKVDRFVGYVEKSEEKAGKSKKDAESIAWATANKRGMLDNKNKKKVKEDSASDQMARDTALIGQQQRQRWEAEQRLKQPTAPAPAAPAPAAPVQATPEQIANHPQYKTWYDRFYRKEEQAAPGSPGNAASAKRYTDSKIKSLIQQGTDPNDPGPEPTWVKNLPAPTKSAPPASAPNTKQAPPEWGNPPQKAAPAPNTKQAPPEWGNAPTGITKTAPPAETDAQRMNRPDMRESKNKSKSMKRAANDSTGPKFGGYYKGTQKGAPRAGQGFGSMEEGIAGNMTVRSDTLTNLKKPEDLTMKPADPFKGNPNRNNLVSAQARNLVAKGAQTAGPGTGSHQNKALDVKKGDFRKMKHKGSFDFSESTNFLAWAMASGYNVIGNPAVYESAKYEYNMLLAEVKKKVKEGVDPNAAAPAAAPVTPPAPPPTPDDNIPDLKPGQYFVWRVYFDDGTKTRMKITDPKFDVNKYYADKNISVINVDYNWKPRGKANAV